MSYRINPSSWGHEDYVVSCLFYLALLRLGALNWNTYMPVSTINERRGCGYEENWGGKKVKEEMLH